MRLEKQPLYPVDPQIFIAHVLQRFLDATAGVDFTLKVGKVQTESGERLGFTSPGYDDKPWQWVDAVLVGKDASMAARTAAEAWLREIAGGDPCRSTVPP